MKQALGHNFADRQKTAAAAKQELLKKFKSAPAPDSPEMIAKRAERVAVAEAREARHAERARLKKEETERKAAEAKAKAEAEALAKAEEEAAKPTVANLAKKFIATEEERKAERDRKYAARKARSGKR